MAESRSTKCSRTVAVGYRAQPVEREWLVPCLEGPMDTGLPRMMVLHGWERTTKTVRKMQSRKVCCVVH